MQSRTNRGIIDYIIVAIKGFCMGSADVVPGVSGGTMAFIVGIYEELLESIRSIGRREFWQALLKFQIPAAFQAINGFFLISLFVGIVAAIMTLAPLLEWLLEEHPVLLWSFFFGLVVASVLMVSKRITTWQLPHWIALAVGAIAAYWIVGLVPTQTPESWWFLLISGAFAICAMILPGISGSFILVLMGKYQFFLNAVNQRDLVSIALAGIGALVGLVTFAQLLSWLFKRYHDATVATLTGLMIGSLRKVWPWKETLQFMLDRHGKEIPTEQINIIPSFAAEDQLLYAIGLALLGFLVVFAIERFANRAT